MRENIQKVKVDGINYNVYIKYIMLLTKTYNRIIINALLEKTIPSCRQKRMHRT